MRIIELALALLVIALGLVWRLAPLGLPPFVYKYGGSVLWGAMVLLLVGALAPGRRCTLHVAAAAMALAVAVELVRLVHAPWLDAFRGTLAGALLLGRVFSPWNILAYGIGIAAASPLHHVIGRSTPGGREADRSP